MKYEGSLINNMMREGKSAISLEVGTLATVLSYSDRHPYKVVEVKDQNHIAIKKLKATRTDNNGMSDAQTYKYSDDDTAPVINLVKRNNTWYRVRTINKTALLETAKKRYLHDGFKTVFAYCQYLVAMSYLTPKQLERFNDNKDIKQYHKIDICFGFAEEYFDYTF